MGNDNSAVNVMLGNGDGSLRAPAIAGAANLPVGLTSADFSRSDVMQNGELDTSRDDTGDAVLCHYFSQSTERVHEWTLRRQLINTP